jgi:two-component system chemotaxis response regulator CheY
MSIAELEKRFQIVTPKDIDPKEPVLVIDDDPDLRIIVVHQLTKLNFTNISQANSGEDGLELARKIKFKFIFCDYEMQGMNGIEMLHELRENPKIERPPFILAMTDISKEKLMLAVESGVDAILAKPYPLSEVAIKLQTAFKAFYNPTNPEKAYELAKWLIRKNQYDEAAAVYDTLRSTAPQSARPLVGLARLAKEKGDFPHALHLLDEAENRNEHFVHLYTERADVKLKLGDPKSALTALRQAIYISPLNGWRYQTALELLMEQKEFENALELGAWALKNNVAFASLYHFLSQAAYRMGQHEQAVKFIRRALKREPENVVYLNQLGISLKELGNYEEAERIYNQAIKLVPGDRHALYNKAVLLMTQNDAIGAQKILKKLVLSHPDFEPGKAKLIECERLAKQAG